MELLECQAIVKLTVALKYIFHFIGQRKSEINLFFFPMLQDIGCISLCLSKSVAVETGSKKKATTHAFSKFSTTVVSEHTPGLVEVSKDLVLPALHQASWTLMWVRSKGENPALCKRGPLRQS